MVGQGTRQTTGALSMELFSSNLFGGPFALNGSPPVHVHSCGS